PVSIRQNSVHSVLVIGSLSYRPSGSGEDFVTGNFPATAHLRHHDFFQRAWFVFKGSFESHDVVVPNFGSARNTRPVFHFDDLPILHPAQRPSVSGEITYQILQGSDFLGHL